jgi:hypothetical protein
MENYITYRVIRPILYLIVPRIYTRILLRIDELKKVLMTFFGNNTDYLPNLLLEYFVLHKNTLLVCKNMKIL